MTIVLKLFVNDFKTSASDFRLFIIKQEQLVKKTVKFTEKSPFFYNSSACFQ